MAGNPLIFNPNQPGLNLQNGLNNQTSPGQSYPAPQIDYSHPVVYGPQLNNTPGLSVISNPPGDVKGAAVQAPKPATGGGGSTGPRQFDPTRDDLNAPEWADYKKSLQDSANSLNGSIDSLYQPQSDYLGQVEQNLRTDYPSVLQEADANFNTNKSLLDTNRSGAYDTLNTQSTQAQGRKESVLAAARRLYDEQQRGFTQRFGGSTSAGQAATEIGNVALQREFGDTNRQFNDVAQNIAVAHRQVDKEYDTNLMQLTQSTQQAKTQAFRDFQNKLLEINNNRTQLATAKAQSRLSVLQDLRDKIFTVDQQNNQFKQTLEQQRQQAKIAIEQYHATTGGATSNSQGLLDKFNAMAGPTGVKSPTGQSTMLNQPIMIGQIGKSIVGRDELGRNIYDDGTRGYTNYS